MRARLPMLATVAGRLLAGCAQDPAATTPALRFDPNDASGVGTARFARAAPVPAPRASEAADRDCDGFTSDLEAQTFFLRAGGPSRDLLDLDLDLDRDGDGYACEWGVRLRRAEAARAEAERRRAAAAQRRVAAASRCYTGPRGGTYTITAGGNRNYDGC